MQASAFSLVYILPEFTGKVNPFFKIFLKIEKALTDRNEYPRLSQRVHDCRRNRFGECKASAHSKKKSSGAAPSRRAGGKDTARKPPIQEERTPARAAHSLKNKRKREKQYPFGLLAGFLAFRVPEQPLPFDLERITGLEPATSTLARSRSTK